MLVYQRVHPIKSHWTTIFLWFSYGFPMVFLWLWSPPDVLGITMVTMGCHCLRHKAHLLRNLRLDPGVHQEMKLFPTGRHHENGRKGWMIWGNYWYNYYISSSFWEKQGTSMDIMLSKFKQMIGLFKSCLHESLWFQGTFIRSAPHQQRGKWHPPGPTTAKSGNQT